MNEPGVRGALLGGLPGSGLAGYWPVRAGILADPAIIVGSWLRQ